MMRPGVVPARNETSPAGRQACPAGSPKTATPVATRNGSSRPAGRWPKEGVLARPLCARASRPTATPAGPAGSPASERFDEPVRLTEAAASIKRRRRARTPVAAPPCLQTERGIPARASRQIAAPPPTGKRPPAAFRPGPWPARRRRAAPPAGGPRSCAMVPATAMANGDQPSGRAPSAPEPGKARSRVASPWLMTVPETVPSHVGRGRLPERGAEARSPIAAGGSARRRQPPRLRGGGPAPSRPARRAPS